MRNCLFIYPLLFLTALVTSPGFSQNALEQGTVYYRMSSSASADPADTTSMILLFKPDLAVLTMLVPQSPGTGTFVVLDHKQGKIRTFIYADGDTIMHPVTRLDTVKPKEKNYDLRLTGEQKMILGYPCAGFVLTAKTKDQPAMQLSGWMTEQIKSPTVLIPDLTHELPGFPLELTIEDIGLDGSVVFEARRIAAVDTALLKACQQYSHAYENAEEALWHRRIALYTDTILRLEMPALPGWNVVRHTFQDLFLQQDSLKAGLHLHREAFTEENVNEQLEGIVIGQGGYLKAIDVPSPPLEQRTFRDRPASQQTWIYHNRLNYEAGHYPQESNPYNYFPRAEIVEVYRAFVVKDVVYLLHVTTTQANYEAVMKSVEEMLAQVTITGR